MCLRQLIPKTRLRIHSAAQEERRPKALVQSGQAGPPSAPPPSLPAGFHYRPVHSGTKQSRESTRKNTPGALMRLSTHRVLLKIIAVIFS